MGSKYHKGRVRSRSPLKRIAFIAIFAVVAFVLYRRFPRGSKADDDIVMTDGSTFPFAETDNLQSAPEVKNMEALRSPAVTMPKDPLPEPKVELTPKPAGLYNLVAKDIDGQFQELSQYAGSVTLIVNVASRWGYTISNYQGLEELYGKYRERGLVVMAFPCNQFGRQEPDNEAGIKKYVTETFGVTFPMFAKLDVNGANTHPVYAFIKEAGAEYAQDIEWNFVKFLVDREGRVVQRFKSSFDRAAIEQAVEQYL